MYETGMGAAIALPKQSLAQKILAARTARGIVSSPFTNRVKAIITAKKITPPISVLKKPLISVLKLPTIAPKVPVEAPMLVSASPMSAPSNVASGSGSGGSSFSPAGDGGDSESEPLPDATPKLSPVVLIAIGAAALFFLSKKGR